MLFSLFDAYRARFKVAIAVQFQYRVALVIWLLFTVLEPVVYLSVWSAVARYGGGQVGGFGVEDFAGYYLVLMLVNHLTFTWIMHEFEYRIRQGQLSPLLLKPLHPIHGDIAENITYKLLTLFVLLPAAGLLALAFKPALHPEPWAVVAFIPALLLAAALRFITGWTLALAGFWTTRVFAINEMYFVASLFLSGQMAPLSLFPGWVQMVANLLPFRWGLSFPVELILGRLTWEQTVQGYAIQIAWTVACFGLMQLVWRSGLRQYTSVGA